MEEKPLSSHVLSAIPVSAAGLHFLLTDWGTQRPNCQGSKEIIEGVSGKVLFVFYQSIADVVSIGSGPGSSCGFSVTVGLFARGNVQPLAAILGGILIPGLLIAVFFTLAFLRRWALIVSLVFSAVFLFGILISYDAEWVEYRGSGANKYLYEPYAHNVVASPIIATSISRSFCRGCTEFQLWGLYARQYVPKPLALLMGMVMPLLFLLTAIAIGLRPIVRRRDKA